jgi:hypothetical protein
MSERLAFSKISEADDGVAVDHEQARGGATTAAVANVARFSSNTGEP